MHAFREQRRQQRLDRGDSAPGRPDVVGLLHLRRGWGVVGGDPVDRPVGHRLPQPVDVFSAAQRRRALAERAKLFEVRLVEQQVVRTGLDTDVLAVGAGLADEPG